MFCSQNDHQPSLFDQTVRDTDEEFYATFPQARVAQARSIADNTPIDDLNLLSFGQQLLYQPQDHQEYTWSNPEFSPVSDTHHHNISQVPNSDYAFSYRQRYDLTRPAVITQSSFDPVSFTPPISFAPHTSSDLAGPSVNNFTSFPESVLSVDQIRSRDTPIAPIHHGRKLRRALKSPTPELTNGRELSVMHLDDFSEPLSSRDSGTQINYFHTKQRRPHSVSQLPSRSLTWDSATSSSKTSIRLSPLPSKRQLEKKPPLACLFCRGRKIACGPPLPGSPDKTCNQCQRRSLRCEYPSESRRGMRKKKSSTVAEADN